MNACFVGIDVSKATLDVGFCPDVLKPFQLKNDPEGFAQLIACLNEFEVGRVVLEATGGYEKAVFTALRMEGLNVVRVNPKRPHDYAKAMGKLAKTDKIDASAYGGLIEAMTIDGKVYALPFRSDFWVVYYNKDIFQKAGLDADNPPKTWPEVFEAAKKIKISGGISTKVTCSASLDNKPSLAMRLMMAKAKPVKEAKVSDMITISSPGDAVARCNQAVMSWSWNCAQV